MQKGQVLRFGAFELDQDAGELRKQGRLVALTGQPLRVLDLLASNPRQLVTRAEIQRVIWGDQTHVDFDASLSTCINQVRSALGDRAAAPRFVETLPRRGYRFVAPVEIVAQTAGENATVPPHVVTNRWPWTIVGGAIAAAVAAVVLLNQPTSPSPMAAASGPVGIRPVPVVVLPVWFDRSLSALEPLASTLTDAFIGALATEGGPRLRVASPIAVMHLREGRTTIDDIADLGAEYFVTTKLGPIGERINVHAKVTDIRGWMLWSTDRVFRVSDLRREQLSLAASLSKEFLREIQAGQAKAVAQLVEHRAVTK